MIGPGLRWVVEACRAEPNGDVAEFAHEAAITNTDFDRLVPVDIRECLATEGLIVGGDDGTVQLAVRLDVVNGLVSILPARQSIDADFVHINVDTGWLVSLAWRHAEPGDAAAELGTGNGIVAAHLVARYRRVVATDLPGPWMRYAQMTLAANAGRGRPSVAIACDVASALRPGVFDLVVSNTPWSPSPGVDDQGRAYTFMDGGDTGTELPSRFIREAMDLLAPGGTAIMICLDPTFEGGHRPLQPVLDEIVDRGFGLDRVASPLIEIDEATRRLKKRLPLLERAEHVALVIRRPG